MLLTDYKGNFHCQIFLKNDKHKIDFSLHKKSLKQFNLLTMVGRDSAREEEENTQFPVFLKGESFILDG